MCACPLEYTARRPRYSECDNPSFLTTWSLSSSSGPASASAQSLLGPTLPVLDSLPEPPCSTVEHALLQALTGSATGPASLSISRPSSSSPADPRGSASGPLCSRSLCLDISCQVPVPCPVSHVSAQIWFLQGLLNHRGRRSRTHTLSPSSHSLIRSLYNTWPAHISHPCLACPVSFYQSMRI